MKNLLYLLLLVSFSAKAQQKVYQASVFERKVMTQHEGHKKYPSSTIIDLNTDKSKAIIMDATVKKIINDFNLMAIRTGSPLYQYSEIKSIPVELFVQPNGTIDYFKYGFQGQIIGRVKGNSPFFNDSLNTENTAKFVALAENFCLNYKLPANPGKTNFSINIMLNIGSQPKKPSKTYIWNIQMAEACDKPDTVKTLMLNNLNLTSFPQVVFRFKNLTKLDISNNYIEKIPKKISAMPHLKFLSISNNPVNAHKIRFKKNTHLKDLNLQYTGMGMIPRTLARNRKLEILFLGNNRFEKFRKRDFRKMDSLKALNLYNAGLNEVPLNIIKLKKLEELDLYYNNLKKLPDAICDMPGLKTLAVSNNELWALPANLAHLKKLETLYAHHNRLTELPALPDLKLLHIGHNLFKVFPEQVYQLTNLVEFDITHNQIKEVPNQLRKFDKLKQVFIEGNDFVKIGSKKEELSILVTDLEKKDILVR
ncbi:leucine-rich repeat domain-containing protein [Emticicia sp. TH156]|uniref:leucine-rich repeat domain-containing protein n=1 Tax=Emticicia sp. TH156 TaxID=2067454 RepID=UPI000C77D945|nr:leucine-rich repeat domain-containing protein [Emticicia sp. TH156]PLK42973.1 hypothetical protein C0V77_18875 [Emticicia sp. TH156]